MKYDTRILHTGNEIDAATGALSVPVYNASTYHQQDIEVAQQWEYSRSGNPTRAALEQSLAVLENGSHAYAFASGMAAISSAVMAFLKSGDHIVITKDLYGGAYRFFTKFLNEFGVSHTFVDASDISCIEKAITGKTKALYLESPSNPLLRITDIAAAADLAHRKGIISFIDNTFMSPYFQKPLDMGIDISIHSATKFLGGHSDLVAGAVIVKNSEYARKISFSQNTLGAVLSPQDSWLLMRGIKTLGARMTAQGKSAVFIAHELKRKSWITGIYYPGLSDHPGHNIIARQATGFGAVLSFKTDTEERAKKIMRGVKLSAVAVSLGGVDTILSYPWTMSHAALPEAVRDELGISKNLLRLSVGLEDAQDLLDDLCKAAEE